MRMNLEDVNAHVQAMHKVYDKLDSLVESSNPLTPNDIFAFALINLLPDDWAHVVAPVIQRTWN